MLCNYVMIVQKQLAQIKSTKKTLPIGKFNLYFHYKSIKGGEKATQ